jgi:spermidine synthase
VVLGQGEQWVAGEDAGCDVLMVDGYNGRQQAAELATEDFYAHSRNALLPEGVLVVNLWSSDPSYDTYVQRIERVFEMVVVIPATRRGNMAVLAFARKPRELRWPKLRERARQLEKRFGLEFTTMLAGVRELNPCSDKGLHI